MASISNDPNGRRRILFVGSDGERKAIRLGKVSLRHAESVKIKIEDLVSASITGHAAADKTARWLAELDDPMIDKLVRVGLAQPRRKVTLREWLKQLLDDRKDELKPESLRKLEQTRDKLLDFFDPDTPLRAITREQAAAWRQDLKNSKLSEASVKTHSGNAKTMLAEAVRRKLIPENPFQHLKTGPTPSQYTRYVTPDEIDRIIEACPDAEWRLLFGLARHAGLRIPSESHLLTPADIDWERGRLTVRSPKTEHHVGHEQRIIPITPKLMKLLQDRFDEMPEGEEHLVSIRGKGAVLRQVRKIWKRAGVEPWERLWQVLRQSCEKEWAMTIPQYAVSKWIGHSITVSGRHYTDGVPDELFEKMASRPNDQAAQKAAQKARQTVGNAQKPKRAAAASDSPNSGDSQDFQGISVSPCQIKRWSRGELNPRPVTVGISPLHV